jgi:catalase
MHGFGCHTYRWVNARGQGVWVKYHFRTEAGIRNLTAEQAAAVAGSDPDHATRDLWSHLASGQVAAWTVSVQVMPEADAERFRIDPFDVTKVWRYQDYPLRPLGRMVLDRNPANNFAEMEQVAFSPSNLVPGIEPSPDKLLQGRLFAYPDAHRYRLGANFQQVPVNRPLVPVRNHFRDGAMAIDGNGGGGPNYHPNSFGGPPARPELREAPLALSGVAARTPYAQHDRCDDFEQAGLLWQVLNAEEQTRLVKNLAAHMQGVPRTIQARMVGYFTRAHPTYGGRVAGALGLTAGDIAAARG